MPHSPLKPLQMLIPACQLQHCSAVDSAFANMLQICHAGVKDHSMHGSNSWGASTQVLQEKLQSLEQYTHVAFTSRNGIQAVLDALEAPKSDGMTPEGLSSQGVCCCALGADAELLHQAGVSNVLTPKEVGDSSAPTHLSAWCQSCPTPFAQPVCIL